ncbi:MAG: hypothetical protein ACRC2K_07560 [Clostridium sp.]
MKKTNKKILLSLILSLALIISIVPIKGNAVEDGKSETTVSYGLDGKYKREAAIPIEVEIKNKSKEVLKGEIEVLVPNSKGTNDLYSQEIELSAETTKKFYVPINFGKENSKIKVKVLENGSVLETKELLINNQKEIQFGELAIGVISDDAKALEYLNSFNIQGGKNNNIFLNGTKTGAISLDILTSNTKNLKMLDVILINNFDTSKLTEEMIGNLDRFVKGGGVLLLGGTENTINNINRGFINATIANKKNKWVTAKEDGLTLKVGDLSGDIGEVNAKDKNTILSTRVQREMGGIILTSFDLGEKAFREFTGVKNILESIMKHDISRKFGEFSYMNGYPYELDRSLSTVPVNEKSDVSKLIMLFGVFIITSSFLSYFILKKFDKRELLWVIIPVLSIVLTVVVGKLGNESSVKDIILNGVNIISVDKEGNGKIDSYVSIGNKYKSDLNIVESDGVKIDELVDPSSMYNFLPPSGGVTDKIGVRTTYKGNETHYQYNDISALELKKFKLQGKEVKTNNVTATLNYAGEGLKGKITNNNKVERAILIFGNNIWELGTLEKGQVLEFNGLEPTFVGSIRNYTMAQSQEYYQKLYTNEFTKEDETTFKNYGRINSLINQVSATLKPKEAYIISITNEDIEYGLDFESDNISKFSSTAYVNNVEIDMKDSQGNTVYPPGYLEMAIESVSDSMGLDSSGMIWGSGNAVIKYTLPEKFVPSEVILTISDKQDSGVMDKGMPVGRPFGGKMEIYNFKTEKFEAITISKEAPFKLTDFKNYVNEGEIKFKVISEGEEGSIIPSFSTKGRFKK